MNKYELKPIYATVKSFYGKATVTADSEQVTLTSYTTDVLRLDSEGKPHRLWSGYSATTMRHINEFMAQFGYSEGGKKWWDSLPVEA